jgi:hypothetical protein
MANSSGLHWMSWGKMIRSKNIGGLGFKDLNCFNKALLAKQGWRLCHNPSSLMGQILKAKYFPNKFFWRLLLISVPPMLGESFSWPEIFYVKGFFGELGMVKV